MIDLKELSKMLELEGIKNRPMQNGNRAGLAIGDKQIMPVVYADRYDSILEALEMARRLNEMAEPAFYETMIDKVSDPEYIKEHARLGLRSVTDDAAITQKYLDLELYVYIDLGKTGNERQSFTVTAEHVEVLGVAWEELLQISAQNMEFCSKPITQVMREILEKEGCPETLANMIIPDIEEEKMMYVITSTDDGLRGSSALAMGNELYDFAENINADLFIFPSSIHEIIAVPADFGQDPEDMRKMVEEINCTEVDPGEKLSDNVYYFCRQTGKVTIL